MGPFQGAAPCTQLSHVLTLQGVVFIPTGIRGEKMGFDRFALSKMELILIFLSYSHGHRK